MLGKNQRHAACPLSTTRCPPSEEDGLEEASAASDDTDFCRFKGSRSNVPAEIGGLEDELGGRMLLRRHSRYPSDISADGNEATNFLIVCGTDRSRWSDSILAGVRAAMGPPGDVSRYSETLSSSSDHPISSDHSCCRRAISCCSFHGSTRSLEPLRRVSSLPSVVLTDSFQEFTPAISEDMDDEAYSVGFSGPGSYLCAVTGLVFHMDGAGQLVYRVVPWDLDLLAQHQKKPAGPLFNIQCGQQTLSQLQLPHCEMGRTGSGRFLSVAHVEEESVEFMVPSRVTETHVVVNITGLSGVGNVKSEDAPLVPVNALALLFYKPPSEHELRSHLSLTLLPKNVVLRHVVSANKKLVGDEIYLNVPPHCQLLPQHLYALSTSPEDQFVLVQPKEARFDEQSYNNYFPSFRISLDTILPRMTLSLREAESSCCVWEKLLDLPSHGRRATLEWSLQADTKLKSIRAAFIEGVSGPVLDRLLDKLFDIHVISDRERETAQDERGRHDKARVVIDTVRRKGQDAASKMIDFLCEEDGFFCRHLGLLK